MAHYRKQVNNTITQCTYQQGTTKTDKCYGLSFDLFTAAVDRD